MAQERRHLRYLVLAQIQLAREDEVHVFTTRNLSLGGAFVEAPIADLPQIEIGSRFDVTISLGQDAPDTNPLPPHVVHCRGRVIRRDDGDSRRPPGFAMILESMGTDDLSTLRTLLKTATPA